MSSRANHLKDKTFYRVKRYPWISQVVPGDVTFVKRLMSLRYLTDSISFFMRAPDFKTSLIRKEFCIEVTWYRPLRSDSLLGRFDAFRCAISRFTTRFLYVTLDKYIFMYICVQLERTYIIFDLRL